MQANFSPIAVELSPRVTQTIRNWTVGQLFDAQVLARHGTNSVEIRVNGATVRAATTLQLQPGDKLKLEVAQLRPHVLLSQVRSGATLPADPIRLALNQSLPKQHSLTPLLEALRYDSLKITSPNNRSDLPAAEKAASGGQTASRPDGTERELPRAVKAVARNLLQLIPMLSSARNPRLLAQTIQRAGVFFEASAHKQIANGLIAMPEGDIKLELLRLRAALAKSSDQAPSGKTSGAIGVLVTSVNKPISPTVSNLTNVTYVQDRSEAPSDRTNPESTTLSRLARMTDGAIAKIETNQLMALNSRVDGELAFRLDIPIDVGGSYKSLEIRITQQDNGGTDETEKTTTIAIEIPLTEASVLRAVVSQSVKGLVIRLWSPDALVRQSIVSESDRLVENLRAGGIQKVTVTLREINSFEQWTKKPEKLVDEKA
ncbi:MAG: hypothetical protein ACI915_002537 [Gammaproteobacteria bacterium]|jgi:hypothetical protein